MGYQIASQRRPDGAVELPADIDPLHFFLLWVRLRHVCEAAARRTALRAGMHVGSQPGVQLGLASFLPLRSCGVAVEVTDVLPQATYADSSVHTRNRQL